MNSNPAISVVIPVYNGADYLHEAVESILRQTWKDFELIIIDDGSTDNSVSIMESFNDPRIRVISNSRNRGLEYCLNTGLRLARGSYVARMDCDDISLPSRLEKQFRFMETHKEVSVCGSYIELFGALSGIEKHPLQHEEILCQLLFASPFAHPSIIMRKDFFVKNNIFYDESGAFTRAEDYELWVRISSTCIFANLPEVLLKYRTHHRQIRTQNSAEQKEVSNRLREQQLLALGIACTRQDILLHEMIITGVFPRSTEFLRDAVLWIRKIILANDTKKIYNKTVLDTILSEYWTDICSCTVKLGLPALKIYVQAPCRKKPGTLLFKFLKLVLNDLFSRAEQATRRLQ
jgi:glycosyltransferase involved in cell wall biosynthesis